MNSQRIDTTEAALKATLMIQIRTALEETNKTLRTQLYNWHSAVHQVIFFSGITRADRQLVSIYGLICWLTPNSFRLLLQIAWNGFLHKIFPLGSTIEVTTEQLAQENTSRYLNRLRSELIDCGLSPDIVRTLIANDHNQSYYWSGPDDLLFDIQRLSQNDDARIRKLFSNSPFQPANRPPRSTDPDRDNYPDPTTIDDQ